MTSMESRAAAARQPWPANRIELWPIEKLTKDI